LYETLVTPCLVVVKLRRLFFTSFPLYQWHVELAHAGYVARMKQTPDKSDWTDAKLLADLTRAGYIPRVWLAPQYIRNVSLKADVPTPWDIFFAVSPFSVLAYVTLSIFL